MDVIEKYKLKEVLILKKEEIKAVLFDLDDTLVNSKKAEYNAICEFKRGYDEFKQIGNDEFAKSWNKITMKIYERYHQGEISFEELRMGRMKGLFNYYSTNISDEEAKERFKEYQNIYERNWILFDDVKNVLEKLKHKYKLVILSNGDGKQQRKKIEYTGLNEYFSDIIISGEVGYSKPEKEIFQIACKTINLNPENCIMVGDQYKVDVDGSLNVGIKGIWVNRKKENIEYKYTIDELSELENYL